MVLILALLKDAYFTYTLPKKEDLFCQQSLKVPAQQVLSSYLMIHNNIFSCKNQEIFWNQKTSTLGLLWFSIQLFLLKVFLLLRSIDNYVDRCSKTLLPKQSCNCHPGLQSHAVTFAWFTHTPLPLLQSSSVVHLKPKDFH